MAITKFSDRYGFTKPNNIFQTNTINEDLKNRIWNLIYYEFVDKLSSKNIGGWDIIYTSEDRIFVIKIYDNFFKEKINISDLDRSFLVDNLEQKYFNLPWYDIYNFLEFLSYIYHSISDNFYQKANDVLESENSAYRFINKLIVPIIDKVEVVEIEDAMKSPYAPVTKHLSKALELFSKKENPDYENSIKESISAVESLCKLLAGKNGSSLGACISSLESKVDKHFKNSIKSLYSWTSTKSGIRHASTEELLETSFNEAKYMLVICSAFINYMIAKNAKGNIG